MKESRWEKFYILLVLLISFYQFFINKKFDQTDIVFTLLVLGIMAEALIFQVTSYVPRDNNIFFHSFAIAYLLNQLDKIGLIRSRYATHFLTLLILLWWSEKFWRYTERLVAKILPSKQETENVVDINTYIIERDDCNIYADLSKWKTTSTHTFKHVKMPVSTIDGINRFIAMHQALPKESKVLNMSELTPLAAEVPFKLDTGVPLWYHLNVGMFEAELKLYLSRIADEYYDVVLFEYIPALNNFYPFAIQEQLEKYYIRIDSFEAPRSTYPGTINVYHRKTAQEQ